MTFFFFVNFCPNLKKKNSGTELLEFLLNERPNKKFLVVLVTQESAAKME